MAETTQSTTSNSSYSAFIPELWSQKLNNMLEKNCVMLQCVNRNWEGEIKNQGDTVNQQCGDPRDRALQYDNAQRL